MVLLILVVALALSSTAQAWAGEYQVVKVGLEKPAQDLSRTTLTVQAGDDPLDRFRVVRIRQRGGWRRAGPPVMLIAPFGFSESFWELTTGDYGSAFAPQLARAGYDVWLVGNRISPEAGQCESGEVDCSAMASWDQQTAIDDTLFARTLVGWAHPWRRPVVGGFSGGSSTAMATVDAHPYLFEGLMMWEGTLYSADAQVRARNAAFCQLERALLDAGQFVDPSAQGFKLLVDLAATAPEEPTPLPGFPPGTTNLQAALFALTQPNPDSPLSFTEGFVRLSGNPFTVTLEFADLERVLAIGPLLASYAPIAFLADTHCAIGGGVSQFTDDLDAFEGDVLVFAAGRGFGQMMLDTAERMISADVTVSFEPTYGESDRYMHRDWQAEALEPMVDWLGRVY